MNKLNKPNIPNLQAYYAIGMDPKTGLPLKMADELEDGALKSQIKAQVQLVDQQDAVNRFVWYNLPEGLDGQLLERILYYRGQGMFFYMDELNKFFFLPYALDGTIDVYGRFTGTTPLPFNGGPAAIGDDGKSKEKPWIQGLIRYPKYSVVSPDKLKVKDITEGCVLLKDYTPQLSETVIPRYSINNGIVDVISECIPYMRTALIKGTGVDGLRVGNTDEQSNVAAANRSIRKAALKGDPHVPIVGAVEFQNLNEGNISKSEEFLLAMQGLDNFRLSALGIDNGGLFQKKAHMLEDEAKMAGGNVGLVLQDSLSRRQEFCDIVNSVFGLGIWCDVAETVSGMDKNGDGELSEQQDQSGAEPGQQDSTEGGETNE